jgi:hypothetical protein
MKREVAQNNFFVASVQAFPIMNSLDRQPFTDFILTSWQAEVRSLKKLFSSAAKKFSAICAKQAVFSVLFAFWANSSKAYIAAFSCLLGKSKMRIGRFPGS